MKNKITVRSVIVGTNRVEISYHVEGEIQKYFYEEKEPVFWVEYSKAVEGIPLGIAVIPFVVNVLPIVWLSDATLEVDELDKAFHDNIIHFKKGYIDMYPMLDFKGNIQVKRICETSNKSFGGVATFFSGGVDAFATLIAHAAEKPVLLTVWGADIKHDDLEGWKNVLSHTEATVGLFGVDSIQIKSNFRYFINESALSSFVKKSGDGWWHGFQHGIGLIGHAAPIAVKYGLYKVYIASSYTQQDRGLVTCASDPTIDNFVHYGCCQTVHDQYEYSRQEKIQHICEYVKKSGKQISLRVCWQSSGGENCCLCEKCYRTMMGLLAEGEDISKYGFKYVPWQVVSNDIKKKLILSSIVQGLWKDIQKRFVENRKTIPQFKELEWIYDYDFEKVNCTFRKRMIRVYRKCRSIGGGVKALLLGK